MDRGRRRAGDDARAGFPGGRGAGEAAREPRLARALGGAAAFVVLERRGFVAGGEVPAEPAARAAQPHLRAGRDPRRVFWGSSPSTPIWKSVLTRTCYQGLPLPPFDWKTQNIHRITREYPRQIKPAPIPRCFKSNMSVTDRPGGMVVPSKPSPTRDTPSKTKTHLAFTCSGLSSRVAR